MKNKKWLWVTLIILLTLVVLGGVAGASYRMGIMQGANFANNGAQQFLPFGHMRGFEGNFNGQYARDPHMMQGFGQNERGHGGFDHRRGGFGFSPLFGLLHLILIALVLWGAYKLYQNSGWKFTKVQPAEMEPADAKPVTKKKK